MLRLTCAEEHLQKSFSGPLAWIWQPYQRATQIGKVPQWNSPYFHQASAIKISLIVGHTAFFNKNAAASLSPNQKEKLGAMQCLVKVL